ncbi:SpvB/TcaC N-terminal domain-containing protein [Micromonospora sp. WMMA1363]|uniref:SpvB/TcaC N-terminal domain-containing protein n=1 Tax=Micromonospora sp. WMMA1363 TaxID=3053985 RepID=UPI00259CA750|nr:SpvB/TcaC N-terminal domain-containing protein [Micromonospora sp. WMMA1363]MDM4719572.1 SpvB/TcaC N-terminal domain-containing protein [Micromonospora sp. WMMA1363]
MTVQRLFRGRFVVVPILVLSLAITGLTAPEALHTPVSGGPDAGSAVTGPETPEGTSFNPNQIKDIKAADPGAGVNLIEAPTANMTGDARLAYPLEVPKGRGGLQPELLIAYNSAGGNGWTGVGWDLSTPSITVDTRWGVPRYDGAEETESYVLNGEQLTPVAHRGKLQARTSEKVFHSRVEGRFDRIVRHGDKPSNYWWEVTDKQGTRTVYGGAENATLADASGNIAVWAAREVRDAHDNLLRYHHVRVDDGGVANATVPGRALYPRRITYTGHGGTEGRYSVTFVRDRDRGEPRRGDVQIDARYGFKRVTADLLRRVEVKLDDELIRAYELNYRTGAFAKTLLQSVSQFGEDNRLFNTHRFDYFDDVRDQSGAYTAFAAAEGWTVPDDNLGVNIRAGEASALSSNTTVGAGGHLYVGYNPAAPVKSGSVGVKVGVNAGMSDGLLALQDVNGDNLPDKVFRKNGAVFYRPNLSGPGGQPKFGDTPVKLTGLPGISRETTLSGTAGVEAYLGVNGQLDYVSTTTTSDRYFTDVNADGIADLVNNGGVLYGRLDADGNPTYSTDSATTAAPVGSGAATGTIVGDQTAAFERAVDNSPLMDSVRRWVAPYDGVVQIEGGVRLVEDSSPQRAEYEKADGVRVTVQHNDTELWAQRIGPEDYFEFVPTGVNSVPVRRGDAVYFRVQSILDGQYDTVAWDPKISYVGLPAGTDVNGLSTTVFQAQNDFTLAGRQSLVTAPLTGTLKITGDLVKTAATSDSVTVLITHETTGQAGKPVTNELIREVLPAASAGTTPINLSVQVAARDRLSWKLLVDSQIDANALRWTPKAHYTQASGIESVVDSAGNPTVVVNPPYELSLYPVNSLTGPQGSYTATRTGTLIVEADIKLNRNAESARIFLTAKKRNALVGKRAIDIWLGMGLPASMTRLKVPVTQGDELFFDLTTTNTKLVGLLKTQKVKVSYDGWNFQQVPSAMHSPADQGAFAQPYRGWGVIGYQGNRDRATRPIAQAELVLDESYKNALPKEPVKADLATFTANPAVPTPRIIVFAPQPATGRWVASDESTWVGASAAASSRLGLDTIDIVTDADIAGSTGSIRRGRTQQISTTLTLGPFGGSGAIGTTAGEVDFLDLNGDRFPDVVGAKGIQYSDMDGGLGATRGTLGGNVRESDSSAGGVSFSAGSPVRTVATAGGIDAPTGYASANTARTGVEMPALGIGGNLGGGESDARFDLTDINGDGLPDKVYAGGEAQLNLGYSFAAREPWGGGPVNDASIRNAGVNLGFNLDNYGFAGGVSATVGTSRTNATLADVNGDGLTDRVFTDGANPVKVAINTGAGFTAATPFRGTFSDIAVDKNATLGGGTYFTFGFCFGFGCIVFNPGADAYTSIGRAEVALRDVNGDGLADHVKSTRDNELLVAVNKTGRTNLLRSVTRPMGARIDLDYTRTGNTAAMPESRWVLSRTAVFDGLPGDGVDTRLSTFRYEQGRYDRLEREFLGFGRVVTEDRDADAGDAVHRAVTNEYRNDGYYSRGLLTRTLTADGAGRPYRETVNTYRLHDTASGAEADPKSRTATVFPQLTRVEDTFYEGATTAAKSTFTELSYDAYGNVVRTFDAADEGAADDLETTYGYSGSDAACRDRGIVGIANVLRQKAAATGAVLRHREADIDCETSAVRQVREYLDDNTSAVSDLEYHPNGNLKSVTGPANTTGQRYKLEYGYDTVVGVHVESIVDSFGYRSSSTHNLKYGLPDRNTDQNDQSVLMSYDSVGRLDTLTGPYEIGSGKVTIDFEYHPEAAVPYATTKHLDRTAAGVRADTIDTITFSDGFKRVLQTKKDASVAASPGAAPAQVMTVSGRLTFDVLGRAVERYYPVTEAKGPANTAFSAAFDAVAPTKETFDVLDRSVKTVQPDGVTTISGYAFGADRAGTTRFEKTVTDGNGKQRRTYTDVRGATTAVKEFNGSAVIWTSYEHDPIMQVTAISDDQNNVTRAEYDGLGRRTVFDSPDAGRTQTRYDLAGNITAKITAHLGAAGKRIEYDYDYSRLKAIRYPTFPGNNVTYAYGAPGALDNAASRVTEVRDAAGTVTRAYGALGEVTRETRTITAVSDAPRTYTTAWRYDAFNRVLQLTYPDGEVLTYDYDSGGQVTRATGVKNGTSYTYLDRLDYDKFGQKVLQQAGNGVRTTYTYDAEDRRLAALKSVAPNGAAFQNLGYSYDNIGNITALANNAPQGGEIGGPSTQTYGYDDQYRLTSASGHYTDKNNRVNTYTLTLGYDSIHNTTSKVQRHEVAGGTPAFPVDGGPAGPIEPVDDPSNPVDVQDRTSYDYAYVYDGTKAHAPSRVGPISHAYDANGNLTDTVNTAVSGKRRQFVWDEENRLACSQDTATATVTQNPGGCTDATVTYTYDDKGDRVVKDGDGLSLYPNSNYSERDATGYKHIFVGDSRLTTKTVAVTGTEDDQSFFHADHIGSSGYVTDQQGAVTEHLEYFPFGETWVEERTGQADTPYQFTGKELDAETGLYYYGARYYNPRTQLWASADPALPDYLDKDIAGGITETRNLAVYTYTYNNPILLIDPSGKWPKMPSWRTIGHTTLDVVGMVPIVGEPADLANAGWYALEGDYVNASLSAAAAIPAAGYAANAVKYGNRALDAAQSAKNANNAVDAAKVADNAPAPRAADNAPAPRAADSPGGCPNSFTGGTPVLMADGTHKAIEQVRVGDEVAATDPVTGESGPRAVSALITGEGEKNLVEITVDDPDGQPGMVIATDNHPFWAPELGKWVYAKEIVPGTLLQTGSGSYIQVGAVRAWTQHQRVHNLTVADIHTYYVLAGNTPVLVHNCDLDQGVYVFADKKSGLPYVGQTNNFDRRLQEHVTKSGRRDPDDHVICIHVCGNKEALEAAENELIEELGGIENLGNDINSPGRGRR